jgi:hypothetical protein
VDVLAWPVLPGSARLAWAEVLCRALNRQRRDVTEPPRARARCHLHEDPRRGVLVVTATGTDAPVEFVRGRLSRLVGEHDSDLLDRERRVVLRALRLELRTPLALARTLALEFADRDALEIGAARTLPIDELTGVASLADDVGLAVVVPELVSLGGAVHLVPAPTEEDTEGGRDP